MKLSELIAAVGDEHVEIQNVVRDMVSLSASPKGGKLTISIEPGKAMHMTMTNCSVDDGFGYVPLLIWIPAPRIPKMDKDPNAKTEVQPQELHDGSPGQPDAGPD